MTTAEAGLLGQPDVVQLAHPFESGRVLVTEDRDFIDLHYAGAPHHGIVFGKHGRNSIGDIIEMLALIDGAMEPAEIDGQLVRI